MQDIWYRTVVKGSSDPPPPKGCHPQVEKHWSEEIEGRREEASRQETRHFCIKLKITKLTYSTRSKKANYHWEKEKGPEFTNYCWFWFLIFYYIYQFICAYQEIEHINQRTSCRSQFPPCTRRSSGLVASAEPLCLPSYQPECWGQRCIWRMNIFTFLQILKFDTVNFQLPLLWLSFSKTQ